MFKLGNIFDGGYSAHSVVKRSYDRIDDSIEAIASGDSTDTGAASAIISSLLSAEIAGSQQSALNAAAGISTLQTFSGAVQNISDKLTEMAHLATEAASGYYTDGQKYTMQLEFEELADQINGIVDSTQFNGNKLLSSDGQTLSIELRASTVDVDAQDLAIDITGLDLVAGAGVALAFTAASIDQTDSYSTYLGGKSRRLEEFARTLQFDIVRAMGFPTSIANTDLAEEIGAEVVGEVLTESTLLLATQANLQPVKALQLLKWGFAGESLY
ncbi:MAG: flagellin N-terminal helical domain-containing protein [Planctomycetota bacterium]|jgi:flagellin